MKGMILLFIFLSYPLFASDLKPNHLEQIKKRSLTVVPKNKVDHLNLLLATKYDEHSECHSVCYKTCTWTDEKLSPKVIDKMDSLLDGKMKCTRECVQYCTEDE